MSITWAQVEAIAPAVAGATSAQETLFLAIADRQIDECVWGDLADDGRLYLTAHLATLSLGGSGSAAGPVISETLGQMSRSYGMPANVESELGSTKFGAFYLYLIKQLPTALGLVP